LRAIDSEGDVFTLGSPSVDCYVGTNANDYFMGMGGDDIIDAGEGEDKVDGGVGDDTLVNGGEASNVDGGDGNDLIAAQAGPSGSRYDGGRGLDTLDYSVVDADLDIDLGAGSVVWRSPTRATSKKRAQSDKIRRISQISGGRGNDVIRGGRTGHSLIRGGRGADVFSSGGGRTTFILASLDESTLARMDRITNFKIGRDQFSAPAAVSRHQLRQLGRVRSLKANHVTQLLSRAKFPPNRGAIFTLSSGRETRTFLALNDARAGFQAGNDAVVEITGYSGELSKLSVRKNTAATTRIASKLRLNLPRQLDFVPGKRFRLAATSTWKKDAIRFRSSNPSIISISGNTATMRGKGSVTVTAFQQPAKGITRTALMASQTVRIR